MIGLGTIVNTATVIVGALLGMLGGKFLNERVQETVLKANGICVVFIGATGMLTGLVSVEENGALASGDTLWVILSVVLGALIGEIINVEKYVEKFGVFLRKKTKSDGDSHFLDGFLTTTLTICIGAMSIVGPFEDGLGNTPNILYTKATLDFFTVMLFAAGMGKGCIFSAIPLFLYQGAFTAIAYFAGPFLGDASLANISLVGSILIFCVGINLAFNQKLRVANMLPSLVIAAVIGFFT